MLFGVTLIETQPGMLVLTGLNGRLYYGMKFGQRGILFDAKRFLLLLSIMIGAVPDARMGKT